MIGNGGLQKAESQQNYLVSMSEMLVDFGGTGVQHLMSSELNPSLIISVKEARKLLGTSAAKLSDKQVLDLIAGYTLLARRAVRAHMVHK